MRFPGSSGDYVSTPDSASNSITGDIEIVARLAADDWDAALATVVAKRIDTNASYQLRLTASGGVHQMVWSEDGTAYLTGGSNAHGFTDGEAGWIRSTMDVSGRTLLHYSSDDTLNSPFSFHALLDGTGDDISTPDAAALDITGDIEYRFEGSFDAFTGTTQNLIAKYSGASPAPSYRFWLTSAGDLGVSWFDSGNTERALYTSTGLDDIGLSTDTFYHLRATLDVDNGDGDCDAKFYWSSDGVNWTQIGTTSQLGSTSDVRAGTAVLYLGSDFTGGNHFAGKIKSAQIYDGATLVADYNATRDGAAEGEATTTSSTTGEVWTYNNDAALTYDWTTRGTNTGAATSIHDSTAPVTIGAAQSGGTGEVFTGYIYEVRIYDGIGGTLVSDFNPQRDMNPGDTSFVSSTTGETWTLNGNVSYQAQATQNHVAPYRRSRRR